MNKYAKIGIGCGVVVILLTTITGFVGLSIYFDVRAQKQSALWLNNQRLATSAYRDRLIERSAETGIDNALIHYIELSQFSPPAIDTMRRNEAGAAIKSTDGVIDQPLEFIIWEWAPFCERIVEIKQSAEAENIHFFQKHAGLVIDTSFMTDAALVFMLRAKDALNKGDLNTALDEVGHAMDVAIATSAGEAPLENFLTTQRIIQDLCPIMEQILRHADATQSDIQRLEALLDKFATEYGGFAVGLETLRKYLKDLEAVADAETSDRSSLTQGVSSMLFRSGARELRADSDNIISYASYIAQNREPYQEPVETLRSQINQRVKRAKSHYTPHVIPDIAGVYDQEYKMIKELRSLEIGFELYRYKLANGEYPEKLTDLLMELPKCPWCGGEYVYTTLDDGGYYLDISWSGLDQSGDMGLSWDPNEMDDWMLQDWTEEGEPTDTEPVEVEVLF